MPLVIRFVKPPQINFLQLIELVCFNLVTKTRNNPISSFSDELWKVEKAIFIYCPHLKFIYNLINF